jgi:transposase
MTKIEKKQYNHILTQMSEEMFNQIVLPLLPQGKRGPKPKVPLLRIFNYILKVLYLGCQWKECPIEKDKEGKPEIHYSNVFRKFTYWAKQRCFADLFYHILTKLNEQNLLATSTLHGDGSNTVAKKGGERIGYSGHKHQKGEKLIAIVDGAGNIIAPMTFAAVNESDMGLLPDSLKDLKASCRQLAMSLKGSVLNLDAGFDSKKNRKMIWNQGLKPNIKENKRNRKKTKRGKKRWFDKVLYKSRFTVERSFAWADKFRRIVIRYEVKAAHFMAFCLLAFSMVNLRHFSKGNR